MPEENPVDPSGNDTTTPGPLLPPDPKTQILPNAPEVTEVAPASPPRPPEADKDWTGEDPAKDATKVPKADATTPAYYGDASFFRLVIIFAGWVLILSVGGMLLLAANEKEIPQGVVAAASGLVGLLTGIFAAKSSKT